MFTMASITCKKSSIRIRISIHILFVLVLLLRLFTIPSIACTPSRDKNDLFRINYIALPLAFNLSLSRGFGR
ncbi:hypothetical protein T492DRAFT_956577 [Pavlovales sp. CCMP2436]|nr:hypothetical protein T492DRAFT_956577 [Pavlovales sp. CCMP2436]